MLYNDCVQILVVYGRREVAYPEIEFLKYNTRLNCNIFT